MEKQLQFVSMLFEDMTSDFKQHMKNRKDSGLKYCLKNYMNKNCGKYALKRKITMIRQELLNLERMLDNEY